jgi:hypothetical protein
MRRDIRGKDGGQFAFDAFQPEWIMAATRR